MSYAEGKSDEGQSLFIYVVLEVGRSFQFQGRDSAVAGKDQDFIQLKRFDSMIEVGMGCDFYLPFFKLIPELKFCYSLTNALDKDHASELTDINKRVYSMSVAKAAPTKMIVLTLYFE